MRGAAVTALASALLALPLQGRASAAGSCEGFSYGFTGAASNYQVGIYGSRSSIEYRNPDLCGSDANGDGFSTVWSMVTAYSADDPNHAHFGWSGYAQAGYYQAGGGTAGYKAGIWEWSQYSLRCVSHNNCSGTTFHNAYGPHPYDEQTGSVYYSERYLSSDTHIHMNAAGTQLDETNYNPTGDWASDWQSQFYGETHDHGTDVVGTTSDKATLDYLAKYTNGVGAYSYLNNVTGSTTAGTPRCLR